MGTFSVDVEIGDPDGREFVTVNALVDTGASYTAVPASLLRRLGVRPRDTRRFHLADGRVARLPLGATTMRLSGQVWSVLVIFAPEDARAVLGSLALASFGLDADYSEGRLVPTNALLMPATEVA